jgi:hypothetical protein
MSCRTYAVTTASHVCSYDSVGSSYMNKAAAGSLSGTKTSYAQLNTQSIVSWLGEDSNSLAFKCCKDALLQPLQC